MTSMAFIFGVSPLALATGAGAQARSTIGFTVLGGMLAATLLAIFVVPVLFVTITRLLMVKKNLNSLRTVSPDPGSRDIIEYISFFSLQHSFKTSQWVGITGIVTNHINSFRVLEI